jgi:hypothetical protein
VGGQLPIAVDLKFETDLRNTLQTRLPAFGF